MELSKDMAAFITVLVVGFLVLLVARASRRKFDKEKALGLPHKGLSTEARKRDAIFMFFPFDTVVVLLSCALLFFVATSVTIMTYEFVGLEFDEHYGSWVVVAILAIAGSFYLRRIIRRQNDQNT